MHGRRSRLGAAAFVAAVLLAAPNAPAAESLPRLAELGDREAALAAIADGADVNDRAPDGSTALHWAAHRSDLELVRSLLEHGAEPDVYNDFRVTPLAAAAVEADHDILALLLDAGADVESANEEGQTALMLVARTGRVDSAALLLEHGADANATERWGGQSALMWAAARIKHMRTGGLTPLLYAAREGCVDCVDALVAGGADLEITDPDGITPLIMALLNRQFDTAARLVEFGADVNRWDWWGRSPLFVAIDLNPVPNSTRGDLPSLDEATGLDIAKMLLERGANVNMRLKQQPPMRNPPNDRGYLDGSPDALVIAIGATPLFPAAKASDDDAVRLLLEHGADVSARNVFGITPLLAAAGVGHRYTALRETPIRGAYKSGADALATVELLHEAGAALDDAGTGNERREETAAHGAALEGWTEVIEYLHAHGVAIDVPREDGATPRDLAERKQHADTVARIDELLTE
jgi:ankyrin repeat protein